MGWARSSSPSRRRHSTGRCGRERSRQGRRDRTPRAAGGSARRGGGVARSTVARCRTASAMPSSSPPCALDRVRPAPASRRRCRRRLRSPPIDRTCSRIDGDGRQTRDLLFIDDAVDALVRAGERGERPASSTSGPACRPSLRDLWHAIGGGAARRHRQFTAPAAPTICVRFAVSPVRARIHLGWSPWTDLDDGLARTRLRPTHVDRHIGRVVTVGERAGHGRASTSSTA